MGMWRACYSNIRAKKFLSLYYDATTDCRLQEGGTLERERARTKKGSSIALVDRRISVEASSSIMSASGATLGLFALPP
eukprot:scaffold6704_cov137-Isochrysis_galbana.AAC.6